MASSQFSLSLVTNHVIYPTYPKKKHPVLSAKDQLV